MDNTVKIFIIAVIILYAVLGVAAGAVLHGYFSNNKDTTINQTNSSVNVTVNNQTTQIKPPNNLISPLKAMNIVNKNVLPYRYTSYSAKLVQNGQHPYYLVNAYDQNPNSTTYKQGIGGAKVDAKTGKFLGNGTASY